MNIEQALPTLPAGVGNEGQQSPTARSQPTALKAGAPSASTAGTAMEWNKKSVLLVDSNLRSRESRAKMMRSMGVRVECAPNADAARARLASEKFNLILVDLGRDTEAAESLVSGIRTRSPRQLVGFLVGSPLFVATSLSGKKFLPKRVPAPAAEVSVFRPNSPLVTTSDFGQKIKDAEAAQSSETCGDQHAAGR